MAELNETSKNILNELGSVLSDIWQKELGSTSETYRCELCKAGPCLRKLRRGQQTIWYYQCKKCSRKFGCDSAFAHHELSGECNEVREK